MESYGKSWEIMKSCGGKFVYVISFFFGGKERTKRRRISVLGSEFFWVRVEIFIFWGEFWFFVFEFCILRREISG
jgi:hypothetical protein